MFIFYVTVPTFYGDYPSDHLSISVPFLVTWTPIQLSFLGLIFCSLFSYYRFLKGFNYRLFFGVYIFRVASNSF